LSDRKREGKEVRKTMRGPAKGSQWNALITTEKATPKKQGKDNLE